jgi:hypothetical protein
MCTHPAGSQVKVQRCRMLHRVRQVSACRPLLLVVLLLRLLQTAGRTMTLCCRGGGQQQAPNVLQRLQGCFQQRSLDPRRRSLG